jgi:hypothetical protein
MSIMTISGRPNAHELRRRRHATFYHGTRATLQPGDLISPAYRSNFGKRKQAS